MSATTALNACPNLQLELNENFNTCNASMLREESPFFSFVMNPANTGRVQYAVSPGRAKVRTVELRYDQRINTNETVANVANPTCTSTTERGDYITTYTLDTSENITLEQLFELDDWITICRSGGTLMAQKVQMMIDSVVRARAKKTAQELSVLMSDAQWDDSVNASLTVNGLNQLVTATLKASSTDLNTQALMDIEQALMQTNYCAPVFIGGGTLLFRYWKMLQAGCCADQGVDMGELMRLYGKFVTYDKDIVNATGLNTLSYVVETGATSFIEFTKNDIYQDPGIQPYIQDAATNYMVITDPKTGHRMDLNATLTCGKIHLQLVSTGKLVGMPSDMFGTGDTMRGVKFINQILVTNS
jgi:hypothetical protein